MDIKQLFRGFKEEDFFSKVNLHIHSNYSDGIVDFDRIIERAKNIGLEYISITDHNSVLGYQKSKYKNDSMLIKGVEFDCFYRMSPIHILGYGIDPENENLKAICAQDKNDFYRLLKSRHPRTVIEAIHSSGGIAVLAHPCCSFVFNLRHYVKCLKLLGLDGIEVYYPYNRFRGVLKFSSKKLPLKIAKELNLIPTGGTDEHGELKV